MPSLWPPLTDLDSTRPASLIMPPMHSTPRPPTYRAQAADQTLNLSFPPKTPGGTRVGGMDDWLDGIDLSAEIEFEEEVLTGFGERRGNLFAVDDIQGLQDWQPSIVAQKPGVSTVVEPIEPPALQLPTPSPEPGALSLPALQSAHEGSLAGRSGRNAFSYSSGISPRLRSSRAASDALHIREQLPVHATLDDWQPVASGSRSRSTDSLRISTLPPTGLSCSRSPFEIDSSSSMQVERADKSNIAPAQASLPNATVRRSRSRSPRVHLTAQPRPPATRLGVAAPIRPPRPSTSAAVAPTALVGPLPPISARPTTSEQQVDRSRHASDDSSQSFASNHSRSFSFSRAVEEPPKDDFFARRLRDSYIGPIGITGLAASRDLPVSGHDHGESIEQGISRLRDEIRVRDLCCLDDAA